MPRALDPSLIGNQLPFDHSPLNRIDHNVTKPDLNLDDILAMWESFVEDFLFPIIEDITGIDLSALLPLLDLLNIDFSSPETFFTSLVNALAAIPTVLVHLVESLISSGGLELPDLGSVIAIVSNLILGSGASATLPATLPFTLGSSDPLTLFFTNMRSFFTGIDFTSGAFDLPAAIESFQTNVVDPQVKLLVDALTGIVNSTSTDLDNWLLGLLTGSSLLDAGKLINLEDIGAIAQSKITGLVTALSGIGADLSATWNRFWDGVFGTSGSTGRLPADVQTAAGSVSSTANTAGTNATTALGNFTSILSGFGLGSVGAWVTDLLGTKSNANTAYANAGTAIGNTSSVIDNVVAGLGNLAGSGFTLPHMLDVLQHVQATQAQLSAGLAALQADQKGQISSGLSGNVNVSDYSAGAVPGIFTKTTDTGSGNVVVAGGALDFSGTVSGSEFYQLATDLLTDYFEVSIVMPRRPGGSWLTGGGSAYTYLTGRGNSAGTRRCQARIGYDTLRAGTLVDGTTTWFGSDVAFKAPAGSYVTFRGGTSGGVRIFQILVNNVAALTVTDSGAVSYVGSAYRRVGFGLAADATYLPGSISVLTYNDNVPSPTDGTVCEVYRAATGNTNISTSTSEQQIQGNVFDTVNVQSPDIAWTAASSTFTVSKAGNYILQFRFDSSTGFGAQTNRMLAYVNGTLVKRGPDQQLITATTVDGFGHTFFLRLAAGDTVRPGVWFGGSSTVTCYGDATGTLTYMSLTRVPT